MLIPHASLPKPANGPAIATDRRALSGSSSCSSTGFSDTAEAKIDRSRSSEGGTAPLAGAGCVTSVVHGPLGLVARWIP